MNRDNADEQGSNPPADQSGAPSPWAPPAGWGNQPTEPWPADATLEQWPQEPHLQQQWQPQQQQPQWNPGQPQWDPAQPQWDPPQQQWGPAQQFPNPGQPQWDPTQQPFPPQLGPQPQRRRALVIGAAAGAIVLVAGGTAAYLTLRSDDSTSDTAVAENVLRGSFPDAPTPGWTVTVGDVENFTNTSFARDASFGYAVDYGDTVVTSLGSYSDEEGTYLVAIDASSGEVRWAVPSGHQSYTCATELADGLVLCTGAVGESARTADKLREYRIDTGELAEEVDVDGLGNVAVDHGSVYTSGWDSSSRKGWIAKGTPADLEADWREEYDFGDCEEPVYGGWLGVAEGVVSHTYVAASTSDGHRLTPDDTAATRATDQGITVSDCESESETGPYDIKLLGLDGSERLAVTSDSNWPATDLTPSGNRPYVVGNTAYDLASGDELWSADPSIQFLWLHGDVAIGTDDNNDRNYEDDVTVAYDLTTGDKLWESETASYNLYFDKDRLITVGDDDNDAVTAYDLETGDQLWKLEFDSGTPAIDRVGEGFVTAASDTMTYYAPTG